MNYEKLWLRVNYEKLGLILEFLVAKCRLGHAILSKNSIPQG